MTLFDTLIRIAAFLPWCAGYLIVARVAWIGLKGGSRGMNPLAASVGQMCCLGSILLVPLLLFVMLDIMGLGGTLVIGWSLALFIAFGLLHESKKFGHLFVLPAAACIIVMMASFILSMPPCDLTPTPPAFFIKLQRIPLLPFLDATADYRPVK